MDDGTDAAHSAPRRGRRGRAKSEGLPPELIAAVTGERNRLWKGESAAYGTIQAYLNRHYPRAGACENCGRTGQTQYSLIADRLRSRDRGDYRELCRRCVIALGSPQPAPSFAWNAAAPGISNDLPSPAPPAVICSRAAVWRLWPCKIWTGAVLHPGGYGRYYIRGSWPDPKFVFVHREALAEKLRRPIQPGMDALHHCDVPACYERQHLYEGTDIDNSRDRTERGRWRSRYGRAALTADEEAEIRRIYAGGGISQSRLGELFGVGHTTIGRVVGRT